MNPMREDYEEQLQKMFPDGFMILYTCANDTIRYNFYNPGDFQELDLIREHLLKIKSILN